MVIVFFGECFGQIDFDLIFLLFYHGIGVMHFINDGCLIDKFKFEGSSMHGVPLKYQVSNDDGFIVGFPFVVGDFYEYIYVLSFSDSDLIMLFLVDASNDVVEIAHFLIFPFHFQVLPFLIHQ